MRTKPAIALALLVAASGLIAGCDAGAGPAAWAGSQAASLSNVLTCGTIVDATGYKNGPLTTDLAIAYLTAMQLGDGGGDIPHGTPTSADTNTLDTMAVELMGYSGSRLSDDAEAFALAEENYNPDGPVDASYARRLTGDILALQRDCPDGMRAGRQWRGDA
ncbi:MAG: hypothetical protein ACRDOI_05955 [Trebonia sp.]